MEKKIVSLAPLPGELLLQMIKNSGYPEHEKVNVINATVLSEEELFAELQSALIIIGDFTFKIGITREMVKTAKKAIFIQQPSVGYQHIDIEACTEAGIMVANTSGANTIGVAEHTVMTGLALMKKIMHAHSTTMSGQWRQLEIGPSEISGKTWGIVGMGRIGRAVAERLIPFGVICIYHDTVNLSPEDESKYKATYKDINTIFKTADIISLHCPLTEETQNLINENRLALMKANAVIINVSRGEVIDEAALARALIEKRIFGAALDVFHNEPIKQDSMLLSLIDENVILTPHIAGATNESKMRIMNLAVKNIVRVLSGEKPESLINNIV